MEHIEIDEELNKKLNSFILKTKESNKKIILITSGGCSIRLEKNTVRMIENFSTGTRGALSAEEFLKHNYNVIFFHRDKSNLPFIFKIDTNKLLNDDDYFNSVEIKKTRESAKKYHDNIIYIPYTTLEDYLSKLYPLCERIKEFNKHAFVYLAAAISDFYIPEKDLSEHKIQSRDDKGSAKQTLEITLYPAPKDLFKIKTEINKFCFLITFKLETDVEILEKKALASLNKSKSNIVVANILNNRYNEIHLFRRDNNDVDSFLKNEDKIDYTHEILKKKDVVDCVNIEEILVKKLVELHDSYINSEMK